MQENNDSVLIGPSYAYGGFHMPDGSILLGEAAQDRYIAAWIAEICNRLARIEEGIASLEAKLSEKSVR